jgi:hypothetical protein
VLTDVFVLCQLIPDWLASSGMSARKIAHFYDDATKRSSDQRSLEAAAYSRRIATDRSLRFRLTRLWRDTVGNWRRSSALMR